MNLTFILKVAMMLWYRCVHMDVGEPLVRYFDGADPWIDCGGLLGELAGVTGLDKLPDI